MYRSCVTRMDRLMAALLELQAHDLVRAEDLAQRLEVSVRTIYRDLAALSETGVPLVALPGKGYRLMEGYFLPPLSFTATEAALLMVGGEFVSQRVEPELKGAAEQALRKLTGVLPADRREAVDRWRRQMLFPDRGHTVDPRLASVRAAIQERHVVRLVYHAFRRAEPEQRDVEPLSLVYFAGAWQVAGYCRVRQGPRMFRLDRMVRMEVLDETFAVAERHAFPPPSDAWKSNAHEARVRFDSDVLRWVRERAPYMFVREESDARGPVFVYAARDARDLLSWLLGWGAAVEVLDPPELRVNLAREALAIFVRHAETATDTLLSGATAHADVVQEVNHDHRIGLRDRYDR
jgi:predicted DNA-binding transcriptional regulator YafY